MSRRSTRNSRNSSGRNRNKHLFADVNARGGRERWNRFTMWFGLTLRVLLVSAVVFGTYHGVRKGWGSLFWRNPDYALRDSDIKVHNDGSSLTREQIIAASGIKPGGNILSYSLPDTQAALAKLPQVNRAKVLRYLPNRMEIWIEERKPVAWITTKITDDHLTNPNSYLVDMDGTWFRPKQVLHEYETLPVIVGVVTENLQPKQVIRNAELLAALDLIKKNLEKPRFQARTLDISKGYCVEVRDKNGSLITFGVDDIDGGLERLEEVREKETLLSQQIATVNVIPKRNIPVTWVPPAPPEETEFPPKPVEVAKPTTKDIKARQSAKKPEVKKPEPRKEPKKANPDQSIYKPFLMRA